jgi:hypothetical protein
VSRIATVVFMTYYTVLDGIGGIGLGRQLVVVQEMTDAGTLTAQQADAVRLFLDRMWVDHWVGGSWFLHQSHGIVGSIGRRPCRRRLSSAES